MHMFDVQPSSATPIYRQLVEQVQRMVAGGHLQPGAELPSVRSVAERHAINPMTVSKAYSLLEAAGLLERRRGIGMVVAEQSSAPSTANDRIVLLQPALQAAAVQAQQLGVQPQAALLAFERELRQILPLAFDKDAS